jgi:hypothetical protein
MGRISKGLAVLVCCLLTFSLTGCVTRLVDFTIISTKNIDLARGADFKRASSRVQGEDIVSIIIIIPTGVPNIKTAVDKAIESVPGAVALLDGVLSQKAWSIIIFGQNGFVVEGTPLIDPALASHAQLPSNYIISKLNKKGNVTETKYVSKTEYESAKKKIGI